MFSFTQRKASPMLITDLVDLELALALRLRCLPERRADTG
jgi:hypothetical protein